MSSPGTYPRCSAKSTDAPKYGERCRPLMKPSTTERETSSRLPIRARTFGSTNRAPGTAEVVAVISHSGAWHRHRLEQPIDQRVAGHPFRLRVEVRQHAVAEHGMGERADVVVTHVVPALGEGAGLGPEHQVLGGADAGAERHPLLDAVGNRRRLRP